MRFWKQLFGKRRRPLRAQIRLPVRVDTEVENGRVFWTEDLSVGGLRMDISEVSALGDLTRGLREVGLSIELDPGQPPVETVAEPVWTTRAEGERLSCGWMFCRYQGNARERLTAFIEMQRKAGHAV